MANPYGKTYSPYGNSLAELFLLVAQLHGPLHSSVHQLEGAKLLAREKTKHVKQNVVDNLYPFLFPIFDCLFHCGQQIFNLFPSFQRIAIDGRNLCISWPQGWRHL